MIRDYFKTCPAMAGSIEAAMPDLEKLNHLSETSLRREAIAKTIRHVLGILKVWIVYFDLKDYFPGFFKKSD